MFAFIRFFGVCLLLMLLGFRVEAVTYTVTNTNGNATGTTCTADVVTANCSLKDAITAASANDIIKFAVNGDITISAELNLGKSLTIDGGNGVTLTAPTPVLPATTSNRFFQIQPSSTTAAIAVTLKKIHFKNGNPGGTNGGGALYILGNGSALPSINIENCTFSINIAIANGMTAGTGGGAILVTAASSLTIENSFFSQNQHSSTGTNDGGGAIYVGDINNFTVKNSTFSNNIAKAHGGAIRVRAGTVDISNSTFEKNKTDGRGGAINFAGTTLTINHSTIVENTAVSEGGGVRGAGGTVNIYNSIIADNTAGTVSTNNCSPTTGTSRINVLQNSFTNTTNGCIAIAPTSNTTGASADLAPLSGFTRKPNFTSPVLDVIASCSTTPDQLGNSRPGTNCDIGAVELKKYTLAITKNGTGNFSADSPTDAGFPQPPTGNGIPACTTSSCAFFEGTNDVAITTSPTTGVTATWGGDCTSLPLTMNSDKTCTLTFNSKLTLNKSGSGDGKVTATSSSKTLTCNSGTSPCTENNFLTGETITLTAEADATSTFAGWSGDCSGPSSTTSLTLDSDKSNCVATFALKPNKTLTLTTTGTGTVSATKGATTCTTSSCTFTQDSEITLAATAGANYTAGSWTCHLTSTPSTSVTVSANKITLADDTTCAITFTPTVINKKLTTTISGTGTVAITDGTTPVSCNNTSSPCAHDFPENSTLTLTATETATSLFSSWSAGNCTSTGANTSTVALGTADKTCTATFINANTLTTTLSGGGSGTVTGKEGTTDILNCTSASCSKKVAAGTEIILTANPNAGSEFASWDSGCGTVDGSNPLKTTVTVSTDKTCTATFNTVTVNKTLTITAPSNGKITGTKSSTPVIDCGTADCSETAPINSTIELTAVPNTGYTFTNWTNDCSGTTHPLTLTLDSDKTCSATFTAITHALTVNKTGNGTVTATGINCGSDCTETLAQGATVTLTATPDVGYIFDNWTNDCSGTSHTANVTLSAAKTCTANFIASTTNYTVTINKNGSGIVTGSGGINCGTSCTSSPLAINSPISLSATAGTDHIFSGWTGAGCSSSFTLDSNKTCTVTFTYVSPPPPTYYFAVTVVGSGKVTTDGINCPSDCSEEYTDIATHSLVATPNTGYRFVSWGGSCSGTTASTSLTVDTSKTCTAKFEAIPTAQVSTSTTGTGTGTITVSPAGTSCGVNCYRYEQNTAVTLTAKESTGNRFVKWTGSVGCSNLTTNPLTLTLDTNKACTAQIDKVPSYLLTFNVIGQGSASTEDGTLQCSLNGVTGASCSQEFNENTQVKLIATANPSWGFTGWSGDADCTDGIVTMDAAHSCTATFALAGSLEFDSVTAAYWAGNEGESVTIPVKRLNGSAGQVSVTYTVTTASSASNPASLGEDVEATTGTLTWADGDSSDKFLTVNLLSDRLNESTEQFNVVLSNPQGGATLTSSNIATVSIFDTAAFSSLQIATADYYVNELNSKILILITRAASSVGEVSVNYQTTNGTATAGEDFTETKGTLTWASGDSNLRFIEIPIQVDGLNEETETFTLELTNATGANAQLGVISKAVIHIINTPVGGQGLVQFSTSTYNAAEADGIATISLNRLGGTEGAISADVTVTGGTASVNVDYKTPTTNTVSWTAGDAQAKTLQYPLNADTVVEGTETVQLQLGNAQGGATIGAISKATLHIADSTGTPSTSQDSTQPRVYFAQSIYRVSESDTKILLEVKRAGDLSQALTVSYQTRDGDAVGNVDYVSMQNTLTFAANDGNSQWITIPIYSDTLTESEEQFNVALYNPSENSVLAVPATTTVQISNSLYTTPPPITHAGTVYLALQSYTVEENQKQLTIDVVRADGSDGEVRINYQLVEDTAQANRDFAPDNGELIWADGESGTKTLKIIITDDDSAETEERFSLAISLSTSDATTNQGVTLGSAQATIKIIDDDSTTIQFKDNVSVKEVYENNGVVKINISRVGGKTGEIGVQYELVEKPNISNAAKINVDYYAGSKGSLIWRNQDTADKTLEITLIDNPKAEDTRELNIELFNVTGDAKLGVPNILRLLIKDNDNANSCKSTLEGATTAINCFYNNDGAELDSPRVDIYGTLQGGTLGGTIKNLGTIDGTSPHAIILLPNTVIEGGILTGTFDVKDKNGNAGTASLQNVTVLAGSELRNILIGKGTTVSSSAKLCRGTLFDNNALIPASLNLNCMLNPADSFNLFDAANGIDLSEDIVKNGVTGGILAAINKLLLEKNGEGYQLIAYQNGYYVLITPTELRLLRPSHIQQFSRQLYENGENVALVSDIPLGITYELDGSIQFVTHTGRQIWMQPVAYLPLLTNYLADYGLQASILNTGSLQVTAINDALNYFAVRSQGVITIGSSFGNSGIFTRMGTYGVEVVVVYEIQAGIFVEQVFAPTAANETELTNAFTITGKASPTFFNNGIAELPTPSSTGEITTVRGRWDYVVRKNAHTEGKTSIVPLLDVNGDGLSDFEIRYANGDSQQLFGIH